MDNLLPAGLRGRVILGKGMKMSDLIDRQKAIDAILHITNCKSVRELFEYNQEHHLTEMWSGGVNDAIDAVIGVESATDNNVGTELSTNLAEVGTDCSEFPNNSDAISRQAAIDAFNTNINELVVAGKENADSVEGYLNRVIDRIKQLLPIQPKRGKWIKLDMHRGMADHKCTACKQECYVPTCMGEPMYAFCPNCGAKMEVNT